MGEYKGFGQGFSTEEYDLWLAGFTSDEKVEIGQEKWDRRFLELAHHIAQWSKDPSTKTGSVIVNEERTILSMGYNGFPRGVIDNPKQYDDREFKYKHIVHAERNALDLAQSTLKGATLYCTHPPCNECQKSIIQKGIKRVVWYEPSEEFRYRWPGTTEMLEQAGIKITTYEPTIN